MNYYFISFTATIQVNNKKEEQQNKIRWNGRSSKIFRTENVVYILVEGDISIIGVIENRSVEKRTEYNWKFEIWRQNQ